MGTVTKVLADGSTWDADTDTYSPEAIERAVSEFNARWAKEHNAPQVPTNEPGEEQGYAGFSPPDPSETDSYWTQAKKIAGAALHGTGEGLAQGGDYLASAGNVLVNDVKSLFGQPVSESNFISPVSDAYAKNVPAAPVGDTYETVHKLASEYGPAIATEALTAGGATPALIARMGLKQGLKTAARNVSKAPLRGTVDTLVGTGAGEVGGDIGRALGGEQGGMLGELLASFTTPGGAVYGGKKALNKLAATDKSAAIVALVDRANARLRAAGRPEIPLTMGVAGSKGMQLAEDLTARGIVSGAPAIGAREKYFAGVEQSISDAMDRVRGHQRQGDRWVEGPPDPAKGPISERTVGAEANYAAQQAEKHANDEIKRLSQELETAIGAGTRVDPDAFFRRMDTILGNPTEHDYSTLSHARELVRRFQKNMPWPPQVQPASGIGPPYQPPREDPTYGQVFERRSKSGYEVDKKGQPIDKGVEKIAYAGETDVMREAAEAAGIPGPEFDQKQAAMRLAFDDKKLLKPVLDAPDEVAAGRKLFSGTAGASNEPLLPYIRRVPDTMADVLGNALELDLRGGNAGRPVDPSSFNIKNPVLNWSHMDPEWKSTRAVNNPDIQAQLDDAAQLAHLETIRAGKRSVPGGVGSTIGATAALLGGSSGLGALGGLLMDPSLMSAVKGAVTTTIGAPLANYQIGKLLTDPNFVRSVMKPRVEFGPALRRGLSSSVAQGANAVQERIAEAERLRAQEEFRRQRERELQ